MVSDNLENHMEEMLILSQFRSVIDWDVDIRVRSNSGSIVCLYLVPIESLWLPPHCQLVLFYIDDLSLLQTTNVPMTKPSVCFKMLSKQIRARTFKVISTPVWKTQAKRIKLTSYTRQEAALTIRFMQMLCNDCQGGAHFSAFSCFIPPTLARRNRKVQHPLPHQGAGPSTAGGQR